MLLRQGVQSEKKRGEKPVGREENRVGFFGEGVSLHSVGKKNRSGSSTDGTINNTWVPRRQLIRQQEPRHGLQTRQSIPWGLIGNFGLGKLRNSRRDGVSKTQPKKNEESKSMLKKRRWGTQPTQTFKKIHLSNFSREEESKGKGYANLGNRVQGLRQGFSFNDLPSAWSSGK